MADLVDDIKEAYGAVAWGSPEAEALEAERNDDYLVVYSEQDSQSPSQRYGMKLQAGVFVGVAVFAVFLVGMMMYCSRKQEERQRSNTQAKKQGEVTKLQNKLKPKPWSAGPSNRISNVTQRTVSLKDDSFDDFSSFSGSDPQDAASWGPSQIDEMEEGIMPVPPEIPSKCDFGKDGSMCALCNETFQFGDPVVESNNPQCGHCFHKRCMDKWLEFQNTCPVCNQPYVLQTV